MHQLTEVDKCVLLAVSSGALGGLIKEVIQDFIKKIKNQPARNFLRKIQSYFLACFFYGIILGVFTFAVLMFDTSTPVNDVKKYMVRLSIIFPLITIITEILESFVYEKQDNES